MSVIVKYNPKDSLVVDRVQSILLSSHTPQWEGTLNILINPKFPITGNLKSPADEAKYWQTRIKYLKRLQDKVVEMEQSEKDIINQKEAEDSAQREEEARDITISFNRLLKAFALTVLDEINILRGKAGLNERTIEQLKNAVKSKYDTL